MRESMMNTQPQQGTPDDQIPNIEKETNEFMHVENNHAANFFWGTENPHINNRGYKKYSNKDWYTEWQDYTYFDISNLLHNSRPNLINKIAKFSFKTEKIKKLSSPLLTKINGLKDRKLYPVKNIGTYIKTACFGLLAVFSAFTAFSFINYPTSSADAVSMIMSQNAETKVSSFQKSLLKGELSDERKGIIFYISKGEPIKELAARFHLNEKTIRTANKIPSSMKKAKAGKRLLILPIDGVYHPIRSGESIAEISTRYKVATSKILDSNSLDNPNLIKLDHGLIIPGASNLKFRPKPTLKKLATIINSQSSFRVGYVPSMVQGVSRYLNVGRSCWPTGGSISSVYGWRWGSFHSGIDIANDYGSPLRTIRSGIVTGVGYEGGYGNLITIDHGNGMVTRYGHCASFNVSYGQRVVAGQVIGEVGSTGFSTGPHVHFEVLINGSHVNPRPYF